MGLALPSLPWDPTVADAYETSLKGLTLGDLFVDDHGRVHMLVAVTNVLDSNVAAAGQMAYIASTSITGATGYTVTNTRANAVGGDQNYAVFAGIFRAALDEAASTTDLRYILIGVLGRFTVKMTDSNGAAGDYLIHKDTTGDHVDNNDTTAQTSALMAAKIGRLMQAASGGYADCMVMSKVFGI